MKKRIIDNYMLTIACIDEIFMIQERRCYGLNLNKSNSKGSLLQINMIKSWTGLLSEISYRFLI